MSWGDSLTDLVDLLARNDPDSASAREVAERAGLPTKFITFSGHIDNVWETPRGLATQVAEFSLAPEDGFATSPMRGGDDWTAVRVKGNPNGEWGASSLSAADVKVNDYVNIIQHPGGLPKQIALYHNCCLRRRRSSPVPDRHLAGLLGHAGFRQPVARRRPAP